ncbi:hypothetical protein COX86_01100 [Candidatus Micrarchaeota archaeon CG_4_10_14_0_2_um_filter_60_11]|nr:MAG: hypothetical protein AUJ16_03480 [Candidatus Micrarchaeota archaeon CG1_02_60_51]PIN95773.1 MAG: hypothetical protein COU39_04035 [Candidatus Micrarchaeota archaeon CG10_big_fil_rev_8_21_14_0_10_60_32]PIO01788.1 MAG: hypothetical protein COT58_03445 [Candidatus Micrarchaeota archaeon CG09_land_8_20_14_0_10_60_16]PIY91433.1 MAG: hypothetical protein COY71_03180 [Candidatus Micrarchaeota archaeon CG_4_10_14_0_8_um_filter_60_7]PIZ91183.1 MAG: hypothetical protein COX86_01100 [Candidatus Mi
MEDYNARLEELRKVRELAARKKAFAQQVLSSDAYERLMNIRAASPELYEQLVELLLALQQAGRLPAKLSDGEFRKLIERVLPQKRETKITRR